VLVDEDGTVAKISDTDGPPMITQAASDAIRKWKFRPFERDGQPVKATGFVSFNFNL
jgi:protein TonB